MDKTSHQLSVIIDGELIFNTCKFPPILQQPIVQQTCNLQLTVTNCGT
jgi:hypothetical protein